MNNWNLARKFASFAVSVTEGENKQTSLEDFQEKYEEFPFETETQIGDFVSQLSANTHSEQVDEAQDLFVDWLENSEGLVADMKSDPPSPLEAWNEARSAASALVSWEVEGGNRDGYPTIEAEHDVLPEDHGVAKGVIESKREEGIEEYAELVNQVGQTFKEWILEGEPEPVELTERDHSWLRHVQEDRREEKGQVEEVAERLYEHFHGDDTSPYREIEYEHSEVPFPHRSVSLMNVMNASGSTKRELIESIADWVSWWWDDQNRVEELNQSRQRPMGYRGGA